MRTSQIFELPYGSHGEIYTIDNTFATSTNIIQ